MEKIYFNEIIDDVIVLMWRAMNYFDDLAFD